MTAAIGNVVVVGLGGAVGSMLRYGVSGAVQRMSGSITFPLGTLAVNVSGCLAIGILAGLADVRFSLGPQARTFVFLGVLGGFTTFSTFGYETLALLRDGENMRALLNVLLQVLLGLTAAWGGLVLTEAW